jgi:hypothetical protein
MFSAWKGISLSMNKKLAVAGGVLLLTFGVAVAGTVGDRFHQDSAGDKFGAPEFSLDLFGIWESHDRSHFDHDAIGFGAGVNYFFNRYFGASAETSVDELALPNHLDISAIARYPLEKYSLAPYVFGGFGRQWRDESQWTGHIGGGVEYRFNRTTGLFTDIRGIFCEDTRDIALWRVGVRLVF